MNSSPLKLPDSLIAREGLGMLAQPVLQRQQAARNFQFFDATLLLIHAGRLTLDAGEAHLELDDPQTLLVVPQHTRTDIRKTPGDGDGTFRSTFLAFAPEVVLEFYKRYENEIGLFAPLAHFRTFSMDRDLADTFSYCVRGMSSAKVSNIEQKHRLVDLLLALAGRGHVFARPSVQQIGDRLKSLLGSAPQQRWTTASAAQELAMSEATLRRRLAAENLRFETLLLDIRMHHAMALLQTTAWSIPQIAEASGYRASSRFSSRFRERFGCSPSQAR